MTDPEKGGAAAGRAFAFARGLALGLGLGLGWGLTGALAADPAREARDARAPAAPLQAAPPAGQGAQGASLAPFPDLTGSAMLSGSGRLRLRVLGEALEAGRAPPQARAFLRRDLLAQGYGTSRGRAAITAKGIRLAPVLTWDGNINGGVLQDRLTIGSLVLEADPAFRAKAGILGGATVAAMLRGAWDEGRVIELSLSGEAGWSPRHKIGRADAAVSLCSRNHLQAWVFLDLCALGARSWRQLDTANAHRLSLGLSHVFGAAGGFQELGLRYDRASARIAPQDRIRLSLERVSRAGVFDLALTLGEGRAEETLLRRRIEMGYAFQAGGGDWRLGLWQQEASGGSFLRLARDDQTQGVTLSFSLRPGVVLELGAMSSRSTAQIARYDQLSLNLRLRDLLD